MQPRAQNQFEPTLEDGDKRSRLEIEGLETRGFRILDELLLVIQHGTARCSGHPHDRGLNFLTGLLFVRAFNTLWRARQDLAHGYPIQALMLARAVFEDWVAALWVEASPDRLPLFLSAILDEVDEPIDERGKPRRVPQVDRMIDELGEASAGARVTYDLLSKFAHPRGKSLRWQFSADEANLNLRAGSYIDHGDVSVTLYFLIDVAAPLLAPLGRLQDRWIGGDDPEWALRAVAAAQAGFEYTNELLDEIQAAADAGVPWRGR